MPGYISYPVDATPEEILATAYSYIKGLSPQWLENDANLDTWILQAMASEMSDVRELARDVPDTIFQYFGQSVLGFPAIDAVSATVNSTWTAINNAGYTIPAGTQVAIQDALGNQQAFQTVVDIVIPAGNTTTATGAVLLEALQAGAAGSGLGGAGTQIKLLDTLVWVNTVTLTGATSGGLDAETSTQYNDRLATHLLLLSTRPILANDFSIKALEVPGVYRAVTIDGYNPAGGGTYNNERMVTVAAVDVNGSNVSSGIKSQIQTLLDANRELNFVVWTMDPTRSAVDVNFTAKTFVGYDAATAAANAVASIQQYLNAATWGIDPASSDTGGIQTWVDKNVVRYSEVAQQISNADGIDYWTSLTMRLAPAAFAAADVTVPGPASIVAAGTITPTVT
jgi:Baseplate J-like protein